jgi:short-subunit dehydrogenase
MKYTLITGASRGIGKAIAEYCASKNMNLLLVARSAENLKEIADKLLKEYGTDIQTFSIDLTESDAVGKIYQWVTDHHYEVNVLINNAGRGMYGKFEEIPLEKQLKLISLNQMAMVTMVHQFIPLLKTHSRSYILNVASTACYQPIPYMSVYAAAGSFIHSFTLAIREELKSFNVHVSCLNPGPTATDFFERAGLEELAVNSEEVKMSPEEVAQTAVNGLFNGVAEIIPGTNNAIGAYLSKLFPNKLIIKTVSGLFAPKQ